MVGGAAFLTKGPVARNCACVAVFCFGIVLLTYLVYSSDSQPFVQRGSDLKSLGSTAWRGVVSSLFDEAKAAVPPKVTPPGEPALMQKKDGGATPQSQPNVTKTAVDNAKISADQSPSSSSSSSSSCSRTVLDVWGDSNENSKAAWAWPRPAMEAFRCKQSMALCCKPVRNVLILMWMDKLFGLPFMPPGKAATLPLLCCGGIQVSYTSDRSQLSKADIVEFHLKEFNPAAGPARRDGQLWMVFTMEGQYQSADSFAGMVNLWRSFTRASDVFNPYMDVGECQANRSTGALATRFRDRNQKAPLVAVVSNCQSHARREGLLRALISNVDTHSLGACFNNHRAPEVRGDRRVRVRALMATYKFAFAVENAVCTDYITEKYHRTFRMGVVPVVVTVDGRPGYERYSPTAASYLDVSRFKDVDAACDEINAAAKDESRYMKYHAYRGGAGAKETLSDLYRKHVVAETDNGLDPSWCALAEKFGTAEGRKQLASRRRSDLKPSRDCVPAGTLARKYS